MLPATPFTPVDPTYIDADAHLVGSGDLSGEHFVDALLIAGFKLLQRKCIDEDTDRLVEIGTGLRPARAASDLLAGKVFDLKKTAGFAGFVIDGKLKRTETSVFAGPVGLLEM